MFGLVHTASLSRKAKVGSNGRSAMQQLYSTVPCLFIPMHHRTAIENKFSVGRAFDCFLNPGQDIRPGDQLKRNGATYSVKSVMPYEVAMVGHTHAMVEQEVDPA